MKKIALMFSAALLLGPVLSHAMEPGEVSLLYRTESGSMSPLKEDNLKKVRWLNDILTSARERLVKELPGVMGAEPAAIELVSLAHPDSDKAAFSSFVYSKVEKGASSFIPLVRYAAKEKLNVYIAFEARVTLPGQETRVYPAQEKIETEYTAGVASISNFYEALEATSKPLFNEAISKIIAAAGKEKAPPPSEPAVVAEHDHAH